MHKGRLQVCKCGNVKTVERANSAQGIFSRGIDGMNATPSPRWSSTKDMLPVGTPVTTLEPLSQLRQGLKPDEPPSHQGKASPLVSLPVPCRRDHFGA